MASVETLGDISTPLTVAAYGGFGERRCTLAACCASRAHRAALRLCCGAVCLSSARRRRCESNQPPHAVGPIFEDLSVSHNGAHRRRRRSCARRAGLTTPKPPAPPDAPKSRAPAPKPRAVHSCVGWCRRDRSSVLRPPSWVPSPPQQSQEHANAHERWRTHLNAGERTPPDTHLTPSPSDAWRRPAAAPPVALLRTTGNALGRVEQSRGLYPTLCGARRGRRPAGPATRWTRLQGKASTGSSGSSPGAVRVVEPVGGEVGRSGGSVLRGGGLFD